MAFNTVTYESVLKRWCAKVGIQYEDLLTTEADLFKQYAQARLRYAWDLIEWPETVDVAEETVTDGEVEVTSDMAYILGVYDVDPYENNDAEEIAFQRKRDALVLRGVSLPDTAHVVYKMVQPAFSATTDTAPYRFSEYIAQGAYSDYLRTEGDQRADTEEARAEFIIQREMDIFERQENQGGWGHRVNVYRPATQ